MGLDYAASAPVLTIPPRFHVYDYVHDPIASADHSLPPTSNGFTNNGSLPHKAPSLAATTTAAPPVLPPTNQVAGRKRSRGDIFDSAEDEELVDEGSYISQPAEAPKPRSEPIYGPGMTLIYPDDPIGLHISADSQTGTWAEERQAAIDASRGDKGRPAIVSRKSMRRFAGIGARAHSQSSLPEINSDLAASPMTGDAMHDSPVDDSDHIDAAKLYLGVGWCSMSESPNLAIAARGWARFIENHFPLCGIEIMAHNEGKQLYLVQASRAPTDPPAFWLFAEDLRSGQLLSHSMDGIVRNLTQQPIKFDGDAIYAQNRCSTPSTQQPSQEQAMQYAIMDSVVPEAVAPATTGASADVEMAL